MFSFISKMLCRKSSELYKQEDILSQKDLVSLCYDTNLVNPHTSLFNDNLEHTNINTDTNIKEYLDNISITNLQDP